ncbi:hypothetical protein chiPu_0023127 [Chiloscyllium punctatum]|uniref:Uncharacterized protein n=1 Tax=Chiloscyllium punctatum TaxID=137246 RepID=A0A401T939_CHIPU|nr:hypothetical protein [Chiloscyllium punctatum]
MGNRAAAERRRRLLHNPGGFERLHRRCKDVFPQQIEGVKLVINKDLSQHFQVSIQQVSHSSNPPRDRDSTGLDTG